MAKRVSRPWGIVAFDIDGTLTKPTSSWQFMHERLGTWEKAKTFQDAYRDGRATFAEWADLDTVLWKGLPVSVFHELAAEIPLFEDAKEAVEKLKEEEFAVGTISACVPFVSDRLKQELDLDFSISHSVRVKDGILQDIITKVTPENKHIHLLKVARSYSLGVKRTVAVGDNWVDARILEAAGLGIAFNPQDRAVTSGASIEVRSRSLRKVVEEVLKWKQNKKL